MQMREKDLLRKQLLLKRSSITDKEEKDRQITEYILTLPAYEQVQQLLLYISRYDEVETRHLLHDAWQKKKTVCAPFCPPDGSDMCFYRINSKTDLQPGKFGILQPDIHSCQPAEINTDTICIVPGIAFSADGFRLGYGKGYYDRFLSTYDICSVGLCYAEMLEEELPSESHDKRVNMVVTDQGIIATKGQDI